MDHVGLLRGVNVGTAKRVAMAELRRIVGELGYERPQTLLNSGNVVFGAARPLSTADVDALRAAVRHETGVDAALVVVTAGDFVRLADENPLRRDDRDPRSLSVAFVDAGSTLEGVAPPDLEWGDEELALSSRAVYQWLPDGVLASRVPAAWWRSLPVAVTARNDATVRKIVALLDARPGHAPTR